jgi:Winged helix-turn-helix DNA-binding
VAGIRHTNERERIAVLGLLESVERDATRSQRRRAAELGIALGLVNAYIRRCVKKGLLKVGNAPARRYAYYLTPAGFLEKSRLTLDYFSHSLSFFRQAKADCAALFETAGRAGFARIVFAGVSDLAEIAAVCALDGNVGVVAIVDPHATCERFAGRRVVPSYEAVVEKFDAVLITDIACPQESYMMAVDQFGTSRVLIPTLLVSRLGEQHNGGLA